MERTSANRIEFDLQDNGAAGRGDAAQLGKEIVDPVNPIGGVAVDRLELSALKWQRFVTVVGDEPFIEAQPFRFVQQRSLAVGTAVKGVGG